jgi:hypothetical protein
MLFLCSRSKRFSRRVILPDTLSNVSTVVLTVISSTFSKGNGWLQPFFSFMIMFRKVVSDPYRSRLYQRSVLQSSSSTTTDRAAVAKKSFQPGTLCVSFLGAVFDIYRLSPYDVGPQCAMQLCDKLFIYQRRTAIFKCNRVVKLVCIQKAQQFP